MRRACARSRAGCCRRFPASTVREIAESEICCGSAGIYNLLEPDAATELRDRKVQNILKTDAEVIVSGNPGCLLQIATGLEAAGRPMRIMHLVEVLDQSISGSAPGAIGAVRCDRCIGATSVVLAAIVTIAAWVYTISSASAMSSAMPMPGGWSMSMAWMSMGHQSPLAHAAMFLVMWTVMMVAMMLPSVMPAVLLHRRLVRDARRARRSRRGLAAPSARRIFFGMGGVRRCGVCDRHDARGSGHALGSRQRARAGGNRRGAGGRRARIN